MVLGAQPVMHMGGTLGIRMAEGQPLLESIAQGGLCRDVPQTGTIATVRQQARTLSVLRPGRRQQCGPWARAHDPAFAQHPDRGAGDGQEETLSV